MSTLAIGIPRSRFSETDLALTVLWAVECLALAGRHMNPFMAYALIGGGVMIARHIYGVFCMGERSEGLVAIAAIWPVFTVISGAGLTLVNKITPVTFDAQLAMLDHGIAPAFRTWCLHIKPLYSLIDAAYFALPLVMMIALATAKKADRRALLIATILGGVLVLPWYLIIPAVGPIHVGDPNGSRNCLPSMHCTWALLIWQNTRGWLRWPAGIFAVLTFLATLATGEHYTPDLVAAIPWTWTLNRLARRIG